MNKVKFIYWKEYECPNCKRKLLKRVINGKAHSNYPTYFPYWCEGCGYKEYRDVENINN